MPETARTRASRRWLALPGALALLATPLLGIAAPLAVLAGLLLCGLALARGDWKPSLNALARLWITGLLFAALLLASKERISSARPSFWIQSNCDARMEQ